MSSRDLDAFGGYRRIHGRRTGFFHVERINGRWWLITPDGHAFLSIGLNHIDAGVLKHPENLDVYRDKYRASDEVWIRNGVAQDLRRWGFNTIGWTQEVHFPGMHTPAWEWERYDWADLPYCHTLNTAFCAFWERQPVYPDIFDPEWDDLMDAVARYWCTQMADDPRLIGYFLADIPDWLCERHEGGWLRGMLDAHTETGLRAIESCARRYYQVIHDAIRRYDGNHLILGDRLLANSWMPDALLRGAAPWVDVLSFQFNGGDFPSKADDFAHWAAIADRPLLLADTLIGVPAEGITEEERILRYEKLICDAFHAPYVIGNHFCGAYLTNRVRRYGVKTERDEPMLIARKFAGIHRDIYKLAMLEK